MYFLRWVSAFFLRLFLVVPFIILRHIFHGVSEFFASLAHGFGVAERALKQISVAPYIGEWNKQLAKMCKIISGDEMRHHHAYSEFVERIFEVDPSQMMMAFHYMMKQKIAMPAHFLRESGDKLGSAFEEFSNTAQRIGVYTSKDYVDILQKLIDRWDIGNIKGLNEEAEKARDYLMKLPPRMLRLADRIKIPENSYQFKWVEPASLK